MSRHWQYQLEFLTFIIIFYQTVRLWRSVKDVAVDAEDLRFNSQAGQIRHSVARRLATAATFLRTCVAPALRRGVGPRHSLPRFGTAVSLMKRVQKRFDLIKNVCADSYCRDTVFKETPSYQLLLSSSINDKNAVQAKHIRKVGLPVLLHIAS